MRKKCLRTIVLCCLCLILISVTILFTEVKAQQTQSPIRLKAISMYPKDALWNSFPLKWMEKVNKATSGKLEISFIGGPEIVSPFEALTPVGKGTYDIVFGTPAFHFPVVPDGISSNFTRASLQDQRKAGLLDIVDPKYRQKANVTVIGFCAGGTKGITLLKKRISTLDDFKGLRLRTLPLWIPATKQLGASPVTLSLPEVYSALEKGIVDGLMVVMDSTIYENGWYEVLKYIVLPTTYYQTCDYILMNTNRFDALPKEYQKLFVDTIKEMEPEIYAYYSQATEVEIKRAVGKGLEIIQLSPQDAKKYYDIILKASWDNLSEKAPDTG